MAHHEHHRHERKNLGVAVITASDTRTPQTDESGRLIRQMLEAGGHRVIFYQITPDDPARIRQAVEANLAGADTVIVTGGTGIAARDSTIEALRPLFEKELEGFGELFRMLSFQEVGSAAFLSRAAAGIVKGRLVVALPGSPAACRLALEKLLLPELGHIAHLLKP